MNDIRAAQRAFRERKQTQLAELKAKVQQYEQGEIERNIALQNIAKRLKEENEHLRKENLRLTERVSLCKKEHLSVTALKRHLDGANSALSEHPNKRTKTTAPRLIPSDTSESLAVHRYPFGSPFSTSESSFGDMDYVPEMTDSNGNFSVTGCGLCSPEGDCFCRDIGLRPRKPLDPIETISTNEDPLHSRPQDAVTDMSPRTSCGLSILDNLPAFQPSVPLRRRTTPSKINSVFPVSAPAVEKGPATSISPPMCSGDPANCLACADDTFGQAFCTAICESVASKSPCENCPCQSSTTTNHGYSPKKGVSCDRSLLVSSVENPTSGTITTDVAWRQIKSHPYVEFSDLSLLADVVARRSKCMGPRVVISPPLGAATPERVRSPSRAHKDAQESGAPPCSWSPPRLVPPEILIECDRWRVREVGADAVKEALELLDSKISRSN